MIADADQFKRTEHAHFGDVIFRATMRHHSPSTILQASWYLACLRVKG